MNCAYGNTRLARLLVRLCAVGNVLAFFLMCEASSAVSGPGAAGWLLFGAGMVVGNAVTGIYALQQGLVFEWLRERQWKAVCAGLGSNFVGERTRRIANPFWALGGSLTREYAQKTFPKLREVRGNRESWTGVVIPFAGQKVDDYNDHIEAFALSFNVPYVSFEKTGTGVIRIRCGPVQVPDMYAYPVEQLAVPAPAATDVAAVLKAVPMARDIDGRPWYMPIEENHILIGGESGSGKNSLTWSLVFGLRQARQAGLVKLWGLDPKKVELSFGREHWDEYADTAEGMVELLEKAVADLLERNAQIQGIARKIEPSPDLPLNVIVIDELAYLSEFVPDPKLKKRAEAAMAAILLLGRATGYVLVACTQTALKEVISLRDHYLTKIGLRMPASQVDLLFGKGAWESGCKCDQIPFKDAGAGCAYVLEETSNKPLLVRAAWCSDEAIRMMLANPQAFGVAFDEPLQQYAQGYTGADASVQLGFDGQPLDTGQPAPQQLRWEELPPEVQRAALQYAQQWLHRQD